MPVELTPDLLAEVQEALGLPHVALVEKDFHVARALAALSRFNGDPRLVFGGGTALSRAHSHSETGPVLLAVVAQERQGRGNRFPAYAAFQRDMVYGDAAEFAQCLDVLDALALLSRWSTRTPADMCFDMDASKQHDREQAASDYARAALRRDEEAKGAAKSSEGEEKK